MGAGWETGKARVTGGLYRTCRSIRWPDSLTLPSPQMLSPAPAPPVPAPPMHTGMPPRGAIYGIPVPQGTFYRVSAKVCWSCSKFHVFPPVLWPKSPVFGWKLIVYNFSGVHPVQTGAGRVSFLLWLWPVLHCVSSRHRSESRGPRPPSKSESNNTIR